MNAMEPSQEQMFRTYAWAYFSYHADQRMKTFNFFLVGAGLLAGGITTLIKDGGDPRWVCPLGIVLTVLSAVFWKIDQRNHDLVRNGEAALRYLDSLHNFPDHGEAPHVLRIFDRDDYYTTNASRFPLSEGHFSYTNCLGFVFALFGTLGIFFAIACFFVNPPEKNPAKGPSAPTAAASGKTP